MMTVYCTQASHCWLLCALYDFQTLITGVIAIVVAIVAGVPVWRQLRGSVLQTRISHRETLAAQLRSANARYQRVREAIQPALDAADRATGDPIGEPQEIDPHDAHHLEMELSRALDWYLVTLANTEHDTIEAKKSALNVALDALVKMLGTAHWADHNEQHDEDHDIPDEEWATVLAECAQAKIDASEKVNDAQRAYRALETAQQEWTRSLRTRIARLDLDIAASGS